MNRRTVDDLPRRARAAAAGLSLLCLFLPSPAQETPAPAPSAQEPTAPAPPAPAPIPIVSGASGKNYLNISADALLAVGASTEPDVPGLETGGHDPAQRGFTLQNLEFVFDGAVDPYFRAQANLILQITTQGETKVELEEAFATTTSLPLNLQVKAGQYLTDFGRGNATHPHAWDFVDQPLVSGRMFGGDGLRSVGASLSWLMPLPFFSEIVLSAQNASGETVTSFGGVAGDVVFGRPVDPEVVKTVSDLLYVPRYRASFELTDNQELVVGASAALGPNGTGPDADTSIRGLDAFWKWKSARAEKGFPFVKVQAEAMSRRYDAAATPDLPAAVFRDHGAYGQVVWGVKPMWTVGLRYDTIGGDVGDDPSDPAFRPRKRASLQWTWYPTEYSKLRLQYAHDDRDGLADANSVWLQFEFLLGAHAAHKF